MRFGCIFHPLLPAGISHTSYVCFSVVPDYAEVIKEPIDLATIEKRLRQENHYKSKQMLYADLMLMVNNCKLYNEDASTYVQCACNVEKLLGSIFADMLR
jgi:methyltransferase-like protein